MSGSTPLPTLSEFRDWVADPSNANPFSISRWTDFPDPNRGGLYYPIFGLIYAYLTDADGGLGATHQDFLDLFELMNQGVSFEDAFGQALGISIAQLRAGFPQNIDEYLSG